MFTTVYNMRDINLIITIAIFFLRRMYVYCLILVIIDVEWESINDYIRSDEFLQYDEISEHF
jgi:hypothetical protein